MRNAVVFTVSTTLLWTVIAGASRVQAETTAPASTQACTLEPNAAAPDETVHLKTATAVAATSAIAALVPSSGQGATQISSSPTSNELEIKSGVATFTVPKLPLGMYRLTSTLKAAASPPPPAGQAPAAPVECGPLAFEVVPPRGTQPRMFEFQPAGTYDARHVSFPDADNPKAKKKSQQVVSLVVRGSGFLTEFPQDNQILIDNIVKPVRWLRDPCPPYTRTEERGEAPGLVGYVTSPQQIDLCEVPFDGTLHTVAVQQYSVAATARWPFRVYAWGTMGVGIIAAIIAAILAAIVLWLVKQFKRAQEATQSTSSPYNTLKILFLDPESDTYSLSKFQFYLWTAAAVFGYVYLALSRIFVQGLTWPEIPSSLPGIIAIGAGTAVGAQVINNVRGPKGSGTTEPSLGDLVTSGGVAAPDRVQMLVWTIIGVGVFCVTVLQHSPGDIQTLDQVPQGLLYLMGLSSVGYLGGKLARNAGPIINEVSIVPSEPDEALAAAAVPPPGAATHMASAIAVARQALLALSGATSDPAKTAVAKLNDAVTVAGAVTTTAALAPLLSRLEQARSDARIAAQAAAQAFEMPGAPADAGRQAEIAQNAVAQLDDLLAALNADTSQSLNRAPGVPAFTRTIELRGRNLSGQGLFEIDNLDLPFRMLQPSPNDPEQKRIPEIVIREPENTTMAVVLRLTIDPAQLEPPDRERYDRWFKTAGSHTIRLINLDGQQDDLNFTIPPAEAQSAVKSSQGPGQQAAPPPAPPKQPSAPGQDSAKPPVQPGQGR